MSTSYLSDCQNVYSSTTDTSGNNYMDANGACQNCNPSVSQSQNPMQNYVLSGSCSNAPSTQDGNYYASDGTNYYIDNNDFPSDAQDPADACNYPNLNTNNMQSQPSQLQQGGYQLVGPCSEASTQENFTLFSGDKTKNLILVLIFLLIVGALVYYFYIRKQKKPPVFQFEFF